jgi:oxalate decarboxylase/phosphoglucose isomerase-like protein (cupin superfamily)
MQLTKLINEQTIKAEYGLCGVRTFPWKDVVAPFSSGYCIVAPGTETFRHVNEPSDEEELFIGCQGSATVLLGDQKIPMQAGDQIYIPKGMLHSILNDSDAEFHFFTVWWNSQCVDDYRKANHLISEVNIRETQYETAE